VALQIIKLPDIGEGVAEAEVTAWHVKAGDAVHEDQTLADVMTDKATVEIPSPVSGTVVALGIMVGERLAVGAELVRIATGESIAGSDGPDVAAGVDTPQRYEAEAAAEPMAGEISLLAPVHQRANPRERALPAAPMRSPRQKPVASPAVRGVALEAGIDLRQVSGSGPAGRITREDLDSYVASRAQMTVSTANTPNLRIEEVPVIGLRRRIAENMAKAMRRIAHFSYIEEIDVTALEELRSTLNAEFAKGRAKLTILPFLMQAIVIANKNFPQMNAHYDDEASIIRRFEAAHIGIATQTPAGLMVPVVRHVETLSLWDCAAEVKRLADAARAGSAQRDELSGSTITVTSLGPLGGWQQPP
jgi:2-oxoisovalerate dehydrogenase E2 component (dihydrolipoyl transacylase)